MASAQLDIATYNPKRDFTKTKEPKGRKLKGKGDSFVVQKHEASRLHWDFRLELDGVLKSWAVPKGPSLDPGREPAGDAHRGPSARLWHFEGTIPAGEYGGGTVMLWDKGRWIPQPGKDPSKTIEEGHLHFTLEGERMKGEWVMFRLKPAPGRTRRAVDAEEGHRRICRSRARRRAGRQWRDQRHHRPDDGRDRRGRGRVALEPRRPEGRPREEEGGARRRPRSSRRSSRPWSTTCRPAATGSTSISMTATGCCSRVGDGVATAWTRNGKDWSDKFKALVKAAAKLPAGCLIDGEAVALDDDGKPSFQLLQSTLKDRQGRQPRLLRLRPAGRPRRGHPQAAQHRAQGPARRAARRRERRRSSTATMSSAAARRCSTQSASRAARASSRRRRAAPTRARAPATGSRSSASSARNS